uniref:Uncharacterized protein n=1 Tax=Anguilla anguilla TaxID=7936 RepID=A0A0E9XS28_ANGAN
MQAFKNLKAVLLLCVFLGIYFPYKKTTLGILLESSTLY